MPIHTHSEGRLASLQWILGDDFGDVRLEVSVDSESARWVPSGISVFKMALGDVSGHGLQIVEAEGGVGWIYQGELPILAAAGPKKLPVQILFNVGIVPTTGFTTKAQSLGFKAILPIGGNECQGKPEIRGSFRFLAAERSASSNVARAVFSRIARKR